MRNGAKIHCNDTKVERNTQIALRLEPPQSKILRCAVMFVGNFSHNVDTKGRVFIPSKLRQDLGSTFYICKGLQFRCIRAYNKEGWENTLQKFVVGNTENNDARRRLVHSASEVEMDAQGRIMLSELLRKYSRINDKVLIVGMVDWVEIWDPDIYHDVMGDDDEPLSEDECRIMRTIGIN